MTRSSTSEPSKLDGEASFGDSTRDGAPGHPRAPQRRGRGPSRPAREAGLAQREATSSRTAARLAAALGACGLWLAPHAAGAQADDPAGQGQPAPPGEPSPICTDRPTKSNAPCTVDAGRLQYESDLFNGSFMREGGQTTDLYLATNPTLKYGLTSSVDVEVNLAPYEVVRTHDRSGATEVIGGVGDLYLRAKWNYYKAEGGGWSFSAIPYVKVPTARAGLGDGEAAGGLLLPISVKLTDKLALITVPEFDDVADGAGGGRHLNTAQLLNLAYSLPHDVTVYAELWGDWDHDPVRTTRQYSADVAVAWSLTKRFQVDGGLNLGLNRDTPGVQAYFGVSQKF